MNYETCKTCKVWDKSFCNDGDVGLCERTGGICHSDFGCEDHGIKTIELFKRFFRWFTNKKIIHDPLKDCKHAKNCCHVDGFLCPCDDYKKNK